jgi:hypothetical protein
MTKFQAKSDRVIENWNLDIIWGLEIGASVERFIFHESYAMRMHLSFGSSLWTKAR